MNNKQPDIVVLEKKVIGLLNKLKENHLLLMKFEEKNELLETNNKELIQELSLIKEENKSLKIANNLLGSNEGKTETKSKINSLIKEVDLCIHQLTELS